MRRLIFPLVCVLALLLPVLALAQFDSPAPTVPPAATPPPFSSLPESAAWDLQVHSRDPGQWYTLQPMQAEHGADCSAPPATHDTMGLYSSAVFECSSHLMTAIGENSYGEIVLTPDTLLDLPGEVRFDVSTQRDSGRDWIDLWVTPWLDNLTLPFDAGDVDLQGQPRNAIHVDLDNNQFAPVVKVVRNGQETAYNDVYNTPTLASGIADGTNQAAIRQTFRLTVTSTHIRFERVVSATAPALVYFDGPVDPIGFDQGVVQFAHHSYNPTKDGAGVPATWHWDNMTVSPATPFTIIKSPKRYVDQTGSQVVVFNSPAPAGSYLRFSGIGSIDVSYDNGQSWHHADKAAFLNHVEHQSPYFVEGVPEGTTAVTFRFSPDGWYGGPFIAQDFAFWSLEGAPPSTPTPTSTSTATATTSATATFTSTPALPTSTATLTGTATSIPPTPTAFPTLVPPSATAPATSTPSPTATRRPCLKVDPNPTPSVVEVAC